jgi:hypothetical protein
MMIKKEVLRRNLLEKLRISLVIWGSDQEDNGVCNYFSEIYFVRFSFLGFFYY